MLIFIPLSLTDAKALRAGRDLGPRPGCATTDTLVRGLGPDTSTEEAEYAALNYAGVLALFSSADLSLDPWMAAYCASPTGRAGGVADAQQGVNPALAPAPGQPTRLAPLATAPIHGSRLRRIVLAAEASTGQIADRATLCGEVVVTGLGWSQVRALFADGDDALTTVARTRAAAESAGSLTAALEAAAVVELLDEHDLLWFAHTELDQLAAPATGELAH